ncbi:homoserine dehydrogenase [Helicosporidium sp. ATCC 50920]|nr:homoserine dehydrogenase [Helicosporidium sp. ATCC 50920]|eukprot:KDD75490.1 homoserine dehydrogenase [Helicosporidium sp. ATCC 50920]
MQWRSTQEISLAVGLIGPGLVGKALLEQLRVQIPRLKNKGINLEVRGIMDSQQMLLAAEGDKLCLDTWGDDLLSKCTDASLGVLTECLKASDTPHRIILDCTASKMVPTFYARWMEQGIHVVTPNKRLNSGPLKNWQAVKALQAAGQAHYMYEGTVGAGLPIISTLKTLLDSGDEVQRIEGVLSGTLSYILNELRPGIKFSEVVWGAKRRGFTEPDPRDDLSGSDVTRKVTTLARECGQLVSPEDIPTESLVPESMRSLASPQEFMSRLHEVDEEWEHRVREADERGEVLRYVGSYDGESGLCKVGLRSFLKSHPFASLTSTENIVQFTTSRYTAPPLIVRGPGAGPAVTAAGVFGDLITLARYLGAPT